MTVLGMLGSRSSEDRNSLSACVVRRMYIEDFWDDMEGT
jgi:hypothetical protein